MRTSDNGKFVLKHYEQCRLRAYPDPATNGAPWTIGYGHADGTVKPTDTITQAQADGLLNADLLKFEASLNKFIAGWKTPPTQGQFDAMMDLMFNIGQGAFKPDAIDGDFDDYITTGNLSEIRKRIPQFRMAAGKVMYGLVRRRAADVALWDGLPGADAVKLGDSTPRS